MVSCFGQKYRLGSTRIVTEPDEPVQIRQPSSSGPIVSAALRFLLHCQLHNDQSSVASSRKRRFLHWALDTDHRPLVLFRIFGVSK